MIYLFIRANTRVLVEAMNVEEAQSCVMEQMRLHSAYQTWPGAITGLEEHLQGTMSDVETFPKVLSASEVKEHYQDVW